MRPLPIRLLLSLSFLAVPCATARAQFVMDSTPVVTCGGTFTDSGGASANYSDFETLGPKTFTPAVGNLLAIDFQRFSVEGSPVCQFDSLMIFDGPTTSDPLIGVFCGNDSPGTVLSSNPTGALTFLWSSDSSVTAPGWVAEILCPVGVPVDDCTGALSLVLGANVRDLAGTPPDTSASCDPVGGTDDHYTFTAAQPGTLVLDTAGSSVDTVLAVFDSCGGVELACDDDGLGILSRVVLAMSQGESVVVRVAEKANPASTASYVLNAAFAPGDDCSAPIDVSADTQIGGRFAGTPADGESSCDCPAAAPGSAGSDVWLRYTAPVTGVLEVDTSASLPDTVVSLHTGCPGSLGNELVCDDGPGSGAFVARAVGAGEVLWIRIAAVCDPGQEAEFQLDLTTLPDPPPNDDCANATILPAGFQVVSWTNVGASTDGTDATGFCDYGDFGSEQNENDVWFRWTPVETGCVYVSHLGLAGADTRLTIYDQISCPDDPASIIACVDDEVLPIELPFEAGLDVDVIAGVEYLIRCGVFSTSIPSGSFQMTIEDGPVAELNNASGSPQPGSPGCGTLPDFDEACFGNGGVGPGCTDCPCDNDAPVGSRGGCLNSAGQSARLLPRGSSSVTAVDPEDLRFELTGAVPASFAVLSSGDALAPTNPGNPCFGLGSGLQSAVLDGLRCAVLSTQRHGGRPVAPDGSVGQTTNGWGGASAPPTGLAAQGGFVAGQLRHFQVFYRELPGVVCGTGQNTSQAVSIAFGP